MAYRRDDFKSKVEEHLGGALLDFYKARLARKNGHSKWIDYWTTEAKNLVERSFVVTLLHSIRGFSDRRRALGEVILALREDDASYRRAAESIVKRDFGVRKPRLGLTDEDTEKFWSVVDMAASNALDLD